MDLGASQVVHLLARRPGIEKPVCEPSIESQEQLARERRLSSKTGGFQLTKSLAGLLGRLMTLRCVLPARSGRL